MRGAAVCYHMRMEEKESRAAALAFLKDRKTGVLATIAQDGAARARTVYFASDDSFGIYFVTNADTRKWSDLQHDHWAAFVVSDEVAPQTLQLEGTVKDLSGIALIEPELASLAAIILSNTRYFAPLTRFDPSAVMFLKLTPSWVRFGDFTSGKGTESVLREIALTPAS